LLRPVIISLVLTALLSPVRAETLVQAVSRAVTYFPEVHTASARREASSAQAGQARAEFFPSVNLALGEGREISRNISTRAFGNDVTLTRQEADLSVSQLLFDGGAAGGQVRRFGARTEGAAFTITDTAETVALRTGQAYVDVRRLRDQLTVAKENVAIHEKTLGDVNALADAGRGRRADVTQAEARRALAVSAVELLVGQLNQSESTYKYLTGHRPAELDPPPELALKLPVTSDQAVTTALGGHPAVRAAEKELEASQYDRESARARMTTPRVTVEAGSSRNRDIDGIAGPNQDRYAMLRLRYNLFRGFGDSERVRETEARINEAFAGLGRVRNEVERDVRQAWEGLESDRLRLPQLEAYARASADVAEAYRLQFQLGQRSLLDVLNAENERFNATSGFIAGRAAVNAGEIRLLATLGRLLDALGVPLPQQSAIEAAPR
jgi:adhesin transport system outer membrane protein